MAAPPAPPPADPATPPWQWGEATASARWLLRHLAAALSHLTTAPRRPWTCTVIVLVGFVMLAASFVIVPYADASRGPIGSVRSYPVGQAFTPPLGGPYELVSHDLLTCVGVSWTPVDGPPAQQPVSTTVREVDGTSQDIVLRITRNDDEDHVAAVKCSPQGYNPAADLYLVRDAASGRAVAAAWAWVLTAITLGCWGLSRCVLLRRQMSARHE